MIVGILDARISLSDCVTKVICTTLDSFSESTMFLICSSRFLVSFGVVPSVVTVIGPEVGTSGICGEASFLLRPLGLLYPDDSGHSIWEVADSSRRLVSLVWT